MMLRTLLLGLACWVGVSAAAAQSLPPLTADQRGAALVAIKTIFDEQYVFPEMRPKIAARLDQSLRSGRYQTEDPVVFADRVTSDLREVAHDMHLSLRVDAAAYAAALAPPASDAGEAATARRDALRENHGLAETKILPGNIRYLRITGFRWVNDETGAAYDDAMRFLRGGDAVIIDLRGNGGGSHAAVRYLVSHFIEGDTLELTFHAGSQLPEQSRTLENLPAGRMIGKPLYVLIDGDVASAAEAFAYDVQQFKLGELIGAKTVGAANNNALLPVAPGFILSVSFGRPEHAVSHSNWEGTGITPDVAVPPFQALDVAQARALDRLAKAANLPASQRAEYAWARAGVEARIHPPVIDRAILPRLAGKYGRYTVVERNGGLVMTWPKRPDLVLVPLTANGLFAVVGSDILRVRLTGPTLEILWSDESQPRVIPRD